MAERPPPSTSQQTAFNSGAHVNSPNVPYLRHRGSGRAATFAEGSSSIQTPRRNSILSDSVSEARHSLRSSTDDLFLPRVHKDMPADLQTEESHWHSAPLALALLPAIGGLFFKNGSAVITDVTLLILAAIFLNWSVRLPWDWYRSAQTIRQQAGGEFGTHQMTEEPASVDHLDEQSSPKSGEPVRPRLESDQESYQSTAAGAANKELHIHELVALASCFVFPLIGTWLLHTIRSKLSRPSEGLVSNYNLTIFLLASEIRPLSHLLKMVQARTLHLQRIAASSQFEDDKIDTNKILDLAKRLEELEAHIAETAARRLSPDPSGKTPESPKEQEVPQNTVAQMTSEIRKGVQSELDALNRAVRRYEKRTTVTAFQTESRLQELETRVRDAIALAAATQRSTAERRQNFALILLDWVCAIIVLPMQTLWTLASLPGRIATWGLQYMKSMLGLNQRRMRTSKGRFPQGQRSLPSPRVQQKAPPLSQVQSARGAKKAM